MISFSLGVPACPYSPYVLTARVPPNTSRQNSMASRALPAKPS